MHLGLKNFKRDTTAVVWVVSYSMLGSVLFVWNTLMETFLSFELCIVCHSSMGCCEILKWHCQINNF